MKMLSPWYHDKEREDSSSMTLKSVMKKAGTSNHPQRSLTFSLQNVCWLVG